MEEARARFQKQSRVSHEESGFHTARAIRDAEVRRAKGSATWKAVDFAFQSKVTCQAAPETGSYTQTAAVY
jgi:hypothetical protein